MQVAYRCVLVLKQVLELKRVGRVWDLAIALGRHFEPVIIRLVVHEKAVLL